MTWPKVTRIVLQTSLRRTANVIRLCTEPFELWTLEANHNCNLLQSFLWGGGREMQPSGCISFRLKFQLFIVSAHVDFLCLISIYFLFLQTDSVLHLRPVQLLNGQLSVWQIYTFTPSQNVVRWSDPPGPGCWIKVWMTWWDLERSLNYTPWDPIDNQFSTNSLQKRHLVAFNWSFLSQLRRPAVCPATSMLMGDLSAKMTGVQPRRCLGQQMSRQVVISNSKLSLWTAERLQKRQLESGFLRQHFPSSQPPAWPWCRPGKKQERHCCRLYADPARGLRGLALAKWALTGWCWWNGGSTCLQILKKRFFQRRIHRANLFKRAERQGQMVLKGF